MSAWHRAAISIASVILGTLLVWALAGSVSRPALPIPEKIGAAFIHDHTKRVVHADFARLVGGDWTQATIVCGPVSGWEIDRALGFDWTAPSRIEPSNDSLMIFSNATSVVHEVSVPDDDKRVQSEFTPCFTPSSRNPRGGGVVRALIVIPRARSRIPLHNDEQDLPWPLWYITVAERERLTAEFATGS